MITTLTIILFLCGIAGFILNRNNVILLIVAIELLLLAVYIIHSCFTIKGFNSSRTKLENLTSSPT
jgi:NADH:ubiquinone oxidoreductase subunit K